MAFANTSLSVVGILTYSNAVLGIGTTGVLPEVIGISSDTLQKWVAPSAFIDNVVVGILTSINLKKQQIVTIASQAAAGDPTACGIGTTAAGVDSVYNSVTNGVIAIGATNFGNNVGLAITSIVGFGTVFADTLVAYRFPNLESGNYATDNPIESPGNVTITSSNAGIGKTTIFTQNNGTSLGNVFQITGGGGSCSGWASSITSLINEIATLRAGISTYVSAVNTVKNYKYAQQLDYWSLNKVVSISNATIASNTAALSVLNDPAYGGPYT
jgi:hypothetical protein